MERISYYDSNIKFDRKALTEVWKILNQYEDDIEEIPEKYMWVIEDNMDKDYVFDIENIKDVELMEDTRSILTYLYTNYLSSSEERNVLKNLENIQRKQKEKQYEIKFKHREKVEEMKNTEKIKQEEKFLQIVERKENIFKRMIRFIKNIFRR